MRLVVLVLIAALGGCASTSELRRGAKAETIYPELKRILEANEFRCRYSPDRSVLHCGHDRLIDISVGYLPHSNHLQIWTGFSRVHDDTLADAWRRDCDSIAGEMNQANAGYLSKLTCEGEMLMFTHYVWVPDRGFTDEELGDLIQTLHSAVAHILNDEGMIKSDD